jgi:hypothetical protein
MCAPAVGEIVRNRVIRTAASTGRSKTACRMGAPTSANRLGEATDRATAPQSKGAEARIRCDRFCSSCSPCPGASLRPSTAGIKRTPVHKTRGPGMPSPRANVARLPRRSMCSERREDVSRSNLAARSNSSIATRTSARRLLLRPSARSKGSSPSVPSVVHKKRVTPRVNFSRYGLNRPSFRESARLVPGSPGRNGPRGGFRRRPLLGQRARRCR